MTADGDVNGVLVCKPHTSRGCEVDQSNHDTHINFNLLIEWLTAKSTHTQKLSQVCSLGQLAAGLLSQSENHDRTVARANIADQ